MAHCSLEVGEFLGRCSNWNTSWVFRYRSLCLGVPKGTLARPSSATSYASRRRTTTPVAFPPKIRGLRTAKKHCIVGSQHSASIVHNRTASHHTLCLLAQNTSVWWQWTSWSTPWKLQKLHTRCITMPEQGAVIRLSEWFCDYTKKLS